MGREPGRELGRELLWLELRLQAQVKLGQRARSRAQSLAPGLGLAVARALHHPQLPATGSMSQKPNHTSTFACHRANCSCSSTAHKSP